MSASSRSSGHNHHNGHNSKPSSSSSKSTTSSSSSSKKNPPAKVKLLCVDNQSLEVDLELARMSPLLAAELPPDGADLEEGQQIQIKVESQESKVYADSLEMVFQWCARYRFEDIHEEQDYESARKQLNAVRAERELTHPGIPFRNRVAHHQRRQLTRIPHWDRRFFAKLDNSQLYGIISAAYHLQLRKLVNSACQAVANRLGAMNKDELSRELGVPRLADPENATTIVSVHQHRQPLPVPAPRVHHLNSDDEDDDDGEDQDPQDLEKRLKYLSVEDEDEDPHRIQLETIDDSRQG